MGCYPFAYQGITCVLTPFLMAVYMVFLLATNLVSAVHAVMRGLLVTSKQKKGKDNDKQNKSGAASLQR